jgi:hypothetical protein
LQGLHSGLDRHAPLLDPQVNAAAEDHDRQHVEQRPQDLERRPAKTPSASSR